MTSKLHVTLRASSGGCTGDFRSVTGGLNNQFIDNGMQRAGAVTLLMVESELSIGTGATSENDVNVIDLRAAIEINRVLPYYTQ